MFKRIVLAGIVVGAWAVGVTGFGEAIATQPATTERAATQPASAFPPLSQKPYRHKPIGLKELLALPAEQARVEMMTVLAAGGQTWVERNMNMVVRTFPHDQPIKFFQAVVTRSRFMVDEARPQLEAVVAMDPTTAEGKCAALMLKIDRREETVKSINAMFRVADADHQDLLIVWLTAIACRTVNANIQGCGMYEYLLQAFAPGEGPVLMHQTYANLLDATEQYEKALVQRQIAVKLEPAGWSYQGLGNTLSSLNRFKEADEAYAKAVSLSPEEGMYWQTWGYCLLKEGKFAESEAKSEKAVKLDPRNVIALLNWGQALEGEKNVDQALAKYKRMIEVAPDYKEGYVETARVLRLLGRDGEADTVMTEWAGRGKKGKVQNGGPL